MPNSHLSLGRLFRHGSNIRLPMPTCPLTYHLFNLFWYADTETWPCRLAPHTDGRYHTPKQEVGVRRLTVQSVGRRTFQLCLYDI